MDQFDRVSQGELKALEVGVLGRIPTAPPFPPLSNSRYCTRRDKQQVRNRMEELEIPARVKDEEEKGHGFGRQFHSPPGFERKKDSSVSNRLKLAPPRQNGDSSLVTPMPHPNLEGEEGLHRKSAQPKRTSHRDEMFVNDLLALHQPANKKSPICKKTPVGHGSSQRSYTSPGFERKNDYQAANSMHRGNGIQSPQQGAPLFANVAIIPDPVFEGHEEFQIRHHPSTQPKSSTDYASTWQPSSAIFGYPSSRTAYNGNYQYPQLPHEIYSQAKQSNYLYPLFPHELYSQKQTHEATIGNNGMSTRSSLPGSRNPNCSSAESPSFDSVIQVSKSPGKLTQEINGYTDQPKDVLLSFQRLKNCIGGLPEDIRQLVSPLVSECHDKLVSHVLRTASLEIEVGKNNAKENEPKFVSSKKATQLTEQQPVMEESSGSDEIDVNEAANLLSEKSSVEKKKWIEEADLQSGEEASVTEESSLVLSFLLEEDQLISDDTAGKGSDEESESWTGSSKGEDDDWVSQTWDEGEVSTHEDHAQLVVDWVCI
ncbi:OLC1v1038957C1 [Oldenlandia corymbosa var. corymbosa]|uniref:OLC1v1038957C1 n=1 Tax=Oldenlandia corymbosa var. corymbosa TaxID=529605 RepID=A0AAV1D423_OLDCO|nr:OLC1v1038957C1 [Oldenlandia corymbosa var. corymbosa]